MCRVPCTALGKSEIIAGQSRYEIANKLHAYKVGKRNVSSMSKWNQGTIAPFSENNIDALAALISTLQIPYHLTLKF